MYRVPRSMGAQYMIEKLWVSSGCSCRPAAGPPAPCSSFVTRAERKGERDLSAHGRRRGTVFARRRGRKGGPAFAFSPAAFYLFVYNRHHHLSHQWLWLSSKEGLVYMHRPGWRAPRNKAAPRKGMLSLPPTLPLAGAAAVGLWCWRSACLYWDMKSASEKLCFVANRHT